MKQPAVPLKIFQIGYHKTATTTIAKFFQDNGYKALHWDEGRLAVNIVRSKKSAIKPLQPWEDVLVFTELILFNNPHLYEGHKEYAYLDEWYPEAVFLLNHRPVDNYLVSRARHDNSILLRNFMKYYRTSDPIETLQRWKDEWLEHHAAVREYFADRPQKLVDFDIEKDGGKLLAERFKGVLELDPALWGHENPTSNLVDGAPT